MSIASSQNHSIGIVAGGLLAVFLTALPASAEQGGLEYFEEHVRPLLAARCQVCHNAQLKSGNIDLSGVERCPQGRDEAHDSAVEARDQADCWQSRLRRPRQDASEGKLPPRRCNPR